jgi:hypothetical protein
MPNHFLRTPYSVLQIEASGDLCTGVGCFELSHQIAIPIIFRLPVIDEQFLAGCLVEALHMVVRLDGDTHRGAGITDKRIVKMFSFVYHQMIGCAVHRVQLVHDKVSIILGTVLL